jgi:hypothetical protein
MGNMANRWLLAISPRNATGLFPALQIFRTQLAVNRKHAADNNAGIAQLVTRPFRFNIKASSS